MSSQALQTPAQRLALPLARNDLALIERNAASDAEHLPCPTRGTAARLVHSARFDCGLQLE